MKQNFVVHHGPQVQCVQLCDEQRFAEEEFCQKKSVLGSRVCWMIQNHIQRMRLNRHRGNFVFFCHFCGILWRKLCQFIPN
uniref:Uncharacterized protein n=1 Tax=Arundo donax TaxID=35708 RepID=A0A0A9ES38_ARUDO